MATDDLDERVLGAAEATARLRARARTSLNAYDPANRPLIAFARPDQLAGFRRWRVANGHAPVEEPAPAPRKPEPPTRTPPSAATARQTVTHEKEYVWPHLDLPKEWEYRSDVLRDDDDDCEQCSGEYVFTCDLCRNAAPITHPWRGMSVCTTCQRFAVRHLDDGYSEHDDSREHSDQPLSDPRNGAVTVTFDAELRRRAPVEGRTLSPEETITPELHEYYRSLIAAAGRT